MNTVKNYLAAATIVAIIPSAEGCTEQVYPFPEAVIKNTMPSPEGGVKASGLVRDAVAKCIDGKFSARDFTASKNALVEKARYVNVVCKTGPNNKPNAEILIGPEGVCTSSFETANGKDYTRGSINCSSGY